MNKHVKGENSQKAKRGQKRAITQLRGEKNYIKFTNKRKQQKKKNLTLPILSEPSMKQNQQHIKHTIIQRWPTHTHTETKQNKTKNKTKHQKQAKLQKSKSVTYLHYWEENMLSFSCFLNVLTLRDNLIFFFFFFFFCCCCKEFQKPGPDVFTPFIFSSVWSSSWSKRKEHTHVKDCFKSVLLFVLCSFGYTV